MFQTLHNEPETGCVSVPERSTWARIDLGAIVHNARRLRAIAGVPLLAVIKADAYGHGAVEAARALQAGGGAGLGVATVGEAWALRAAGIGAPIVLLGYTPPQQAREVVQLGLTCTLFDLETARALADAGAALQRQVAVHVKVDTGMGRLGLLPEEAGPFLHALCREPGLQVQGLFTHFATADEPDETFARAQLARFERLLTDLTAAGLRPPLVHAANSAALLRFPTARFDMVRPGIACYGLSPSDATPLPEDFRPALSFHTQVAYVKAVPAGTPLSYGATFTTRRPSRIATIPVGYADGLRRAPAWRQVLVHGRRAPIVGRISMDYALVDVTDVPLVRAGDEVVLIGAQGGERITATEVAGWLGTVVYEVITSLSPRVARRYG